MMKSYIEASYLSKFFDTLIKSERFSDDAGKLEEILAYFKSKSNIILDKDFQAVLDKLDPSLQNMINTLINGLTTGRNGTTVEGNQANSFRNLRKLEVYSKYKLPFASFWIDEENSKHSCEKYEMMNPYYFFSNKNDLTQWPPYNRNEVFYVGPALRKEGKDVLKSWEGIKQMKHPLRDVIFVDRYCLKDKVGISENIIPLVKNLASNPKNVKNVIFFTRSGELFNSSLKLVYEFVKEEFDKVDISCEVMIYALRRTPHDRRIITNNKFIVSGDSFDYFNKDGSYKTAGTTIQFCPIYESNQAELKVLFDQLKDIMNMANDSNSFGTKGKNILDLII